MRPGLGYDGLQNLQKFVKNGGVYIGAVASAQFAIDVGLTNGVGMNTPARGTVTGTFLKTRLVDDASPIVYGVADGIAAYTDGGESFSVSATRIAGGRGGGGGGGGGGRRWTWRWWREPRDGSRHAGRRRRSAGTSGARGAVQGAGASDGAAVAVRGADGRAAAQSAQHHSAGSASARGAALLAQNELLVSGLLSGGGDIAQRPAVVDSPLEKGHVVLFSINPIYRGETMGTYPLVFNTILNFDNLNAGRKVDAP